MVLLTGIDWRANRLADVLAKQAARTMQAPKAIIRLLESGRSAVRHAAALLGVVTHTANHHRVAVQRPDGTWSSRTIRDAQQPSRKPGRRRRLPQPPAPPAPVRVYSAADLSDLLCWDRPRPVKRPRSALAKANARSRAEDAAHTRRRIDDIGAGLVAEAYSPAHKRLEEVRRRVRARLDHVI
jgi:hypothetical protein